MRLSQGKVGELFIGPILELGLKKPTHTQAGCAQLDRCRLGALSKFIAAAAV